MTLAADEVPRVRLVPRHGVRAMAALDVADKFPIVALRAKAALHALGWYMCILSHEPPCTHTRVEGALALTYLAIRLDGKATTVAPIILPLTSVRLASHQTERTRAVSLSVTPFAVVDILESVRGTLPCPKYAVAMPRITLK